MFKGCGVGLVLGLSVGFWVVLLAGIRSSPKPRLGNRIGAGVGAGKDGIRKARKSQLDTTAPESNTLAQANTKVKKPQALAQPSAVRSTSDRPVMMTVHSY